MTIADTMCFKISKGIEECIHELEEEETDDPASSAEEDEVLVDPAYLIYLRDTYRELYGYVEAAGGELVLNLYTRCLLDELYIGRHVSPFWNNLGLDLIYEE